MILSFQKKETDFLDMRRSRLSLAEAERSSAAIVFEPVEKPSPRRGGHSFPFFVLSGSLLPVMWVPSRVWLCALVMNRLFSHLSFLFKVLFENH